MNNLNPFDNQDFANYTSKTFGKSIRQRREQLGISLREMARHLNMSAVYLSDIERGNRPAPSGRLSKIDYMSIMSKALQLNISQQKNFIIMAHVSHINNDSFFDSYFINNPSALKFLVNAIANDWTNDQWEDIYHLVSNN